METTVRSISDTLSSPPWEEMALGEERKLVSWKQQMEYEIEPKATDAWKNDQFTVWSLIRKLWVILKTADPVSLYKGFEISHRATCS